jgi:hypothetical protein
VITDLLEVGQLAHAGHVKLANPLAVVLGRQLRRRKTLVRMAAMAFDVAGLSQRVAQERRNIRRLMSEPFGFGAGSLDQGGEMGDVVRSCWHDSQSRTKTSGIAFRNANRPVRTIGATGRLIDEA